VPEFIGVCHWRREAPFCVADATAWTVVDGRRVAVCDEHLAEAVAAGYANGGPAGGRRDCDCDPRFPEDAPDVAPDCAWPVNGGVPSGLPGRDYVSCHQPGSGHEAQQQVGDGSAVLRYSVCIRHFHTAAEAGWTIRHVSLDETRDASGRFVTAADRVRAARDEALDEALARRATEVARRAHRRLTPVDTGALRSYGDYDAPRSIPAPRFRDTAPDVPVLVAGVVLGTAVGLAALGKARDAVEARVAQYRAARAARRGWPE